MLIKIKGKRLFLVLFSILVFFKGYAQEGTTDSTDIVILSKSSFSLLLDDLFIVGGVNVGGIYYSNNFRNLSRLTGFSIGLEQYFPLSRKVLLSSGFNITERNFNFSQGNAKIGVNALYLDLPLTASFELPVTHKAEFCVFVGMVASLNLNASINGNYEDLIANNPNTFIYETKDFHTGDFGWHFGLSAEYKNFLVRARSYSGFIKLDKKDQGMQSSLSIEIGYFMFRKFKR